MPAAAAHFAQELAEAINLLLRDPKKRAAMGKKARERIERRFSWKSVARQTLEFYRDIVNNSG